MSGPVRLGVQLAQLGRQAGPDAVRASARAAEALGFASAWVVDRPARPGDPECLDPFPTLAFAAACTDRVRLGADLSLLPGSPPTGLARTLACLDVLTAGRLVVGAARGGPTDEVLAALHELSAAAGRRGPEVLRSPLVVRATVDLRRRPVNGDRPPYCGDLEQVVGDLEATAAAGAAEVVLQVDGDRPLDEALATYAALAEALDPSVAVA